MYSSSKKSAKIIDRQSQSQFKEYLQNRLLMHKELTLKL